MQSFRFTPKSKLNLQIYERIVILFIKLNPTFIHFSGSQFYSAMQQYVLTKRELRENCYPHPNPFTPGEVIIKRNERYQPPTLESAESDGKVEG